MVPASEFLDRPGTLTMRDMFEFTPGAFAQPKWGEDSRLSIRGSGLARNFHLRGMGVFQDGIPVNQADGSGDLQELDPLTFQRAEVFRGGNGFALGANTLGGAVNLVTPTGRQSEGQGIGQRAEGGSLGFARGQITAGGAHGALYGWVSGTMLRQDGYRNTSSGSAGQMNSNAAYRWAENAETRAVGQGMQGSGRLLIRKSGAKADRLLAAASLAAGRMELRTRARDGGVLRMRPVADVPLPANDEVAPERGGLHLMPIGLTQLLNAGEAIPVALRSERASELTIRPAVQAAVARPPAPNRLLVVMRPGGVRVLRPVRKAPQPRPPMPADGFRPGPRRAGP